MPQKRKGKHPQSKKGKAIARHGAVPPVEKAAPAPPTAVERPLAEKPAIARPAAVARTPAATVPAGPARYPYFIPELKRIGLLAAIVLVVLVVLSIVLS